MCEHIHTLLYECKGTHIFDNFFIFQFFWFFILLSKEKVFLHHSFELVNR